MRITVKLFRTGRFNVTQQEYPDNATVGSVTEAIPLTTGEIGIMQVNGRHVTAEHRLVDGDILALFPLLGGG